MNHVLTQAASRLRRKKDATQLDLPRLGVTVAVGAFP